MNKTQSFVRRLQSVAWKSIMHLTSLLWMTSRRTSTKLDRFIAKRKSRWPCDACVVHARFARDEIINLAARRSARRFARNDAKGFKFVEFLKFTFTKRKDDKNIYITANFNSRAHIVVKLNDFIPSLQLSQQQLTKWYCCLAV